MAITPFASASNPADNGAAGASPQSVTPPASMVAGDLALIVGLYRGSVSDLAMSEAGGQTWTVAWDWFNAGLTSAAYWCRFNGTWSADPSMSLTIGANGFTVIMHVFRPTSSANTWAEDVAAVPPSNTSVDYAAPSTPFNVTISGITTQEDGALAIAQWVSTDDNTWTLDTSGGWAVLGEAQYRNTKGADSSTAFAYLVKTTAGATGDVTSAQTTLGGDAGATTIWAIHEIAAASSWLPRAALMQQGPIHTFGG